MSTNDLSQSELKDITEFLTQQLNELKEIESELEKATIRYKGIRLLSREMLSGEEDVIVSELNARLLSTLTITTTYVNALIEKVKHLPTKILDILKQFYTQCLSIINKFANLFKIEEITLTISSSPSLQIVFKPKPNNI
ncbi:MAG: hypothetical protein QW416_07155 [Candidatus Nitrosocaldaceae archaeon]